MILSNQQVLVFSYGFTGSKSSRVDLSSADELFVCMRESEWRKWVGGMQGGVTDSDSVTGWRGDGRR